MLLNKYKQKESAYNSQLITSCQLLNIIKNSKNTKILKQLHIKYEYD